MVRTMSGIQRRVMGCDGSRHEVTGVNEGFWSIRPSILEVFDLAG